MNPESVISPGLAGQQCPRMLNTGVTDAPYCAFYRVAGDPDLGPHICAASILPTDPSSLALSFNFCAFHILFGGCF